MLTWSPSAAALRWLAALLFWSVAQAHWAALVRNVNPVAVLSDPGPHVVTMAFSHRNATHVLVIDEDPTRTEPPPLEVEGAAFSTYRWDRTARLGRADELRSERLRICWCRLAARPSGSEFEHALSQSIPERHFRFVGHVKLGKTHRVYMVGELGLTWHTDAHLFLTALAYGEPPPGPVTCRPLVLGMRERL